MGILPWAFLTSLTDTRCSLAYQSTTSWIKALQTDTFDAFDYTLKNVIVERVAVNCQEYFNLDLSTEPGEYSMQEA